jgi:hypothetical protein
MQVSTIAELDTHAVIGGGQAQAFGMSDSAEFFTVLSDTLYRDKKRAVIREVICNAWDAHIMVGKTDIPVEITLNEKELIIKDFGPGIAKDKIGPVYCVYGASTKVKDGKQTGGFGLGCKAPFAYSDHFTVTSCIDGFRTLWAISRGGAATDGKPDFRPMVSVPSTETGITVSIPIKDEKDVASFDTLIREVCRNGGMLAKLNGKELPRYDYTEARKNGFCVLQRAGVNSFRESRAYVLYGTVLYPVTTTDNELMVKVDAIDRLVENNGRLVLVAAPNTIGVQPSREGLSYSDLTTTTLHKMLDEATRRLKNVGPALARKLYRAHVASILKDRDNIALTMPTAHNGPFEGLLSDPVAIAERAVREKLSHYLADGEMSKIAYREMQKKWRDDRRFFRRARHNWRQSLSRERFDRSRKLHLRMASKLGLLDKLVVFSKEYGHTRWSGSSIDEFRSSNRQLQSRIVIAPTRKAVDELLRKEVAAIAKKSTWEAQEQAGEWMVPAFVLQNPSEKLLESIIELGDKYKIRVELLDFPKRKKSQKVGDAFVGLTDLVHNSRRYNWRASKMSVTEPKAYIRASGTQEHIDLGMWRYDSDKNAVKRLAELFPDTAVVWTVKQEAKMKAKKAPLLDDVVAAEIEKLSASREIQYATMMQGQHFVTNTHYYRDVSGWISRISAQSFRLSQFFFPARVKLSDGVQRMAELVGVAEKLSSRGSSTTKKSAEARDKLLAQAKKTYAHLITHSKELDKRFEYLKPLTSIDFSPTNEDLILDMIRFLGRRAAKAASIATTPINNDMKEAA